MGIRRAYNIVASFSTKPRQYFKKKCTGDGYHTFMVKSKKNVLPRILRIID